MNALVFVVEEDRQEAEDAIRDIYSPQGPGICFHIRKKDTVAKNYHRIG